MEFHSELTCFLVHSNVHAPPHHTHWCCSTRAYTLLWVPRPTLAIEDLHLPMSPMSRLLQVLQATQHASNVLHSLLTDMPPNTRMFTSQRLLSVEMLPLLAETLAPTLRPVSFLMWWSSSKGRLHWEGICSEWGMRQ